MCACALRESSSLCCRISSRLRRKFAFSLVYAVYPGPVLKKYREPEPRTGCCFKSGVHKFSQWTPYSYNLSWQISHRHKSLSCCSHKSLTCC